MMQDFLNFPFLGVEIYFVVLLSITFFAEVDIILKICSEVGHLLSNCGVEPWCNSTK